MDNNQGWILVSRGIQEHWIWDNPRRLKWWLDLLFIAGWGEKEIRIFNKVFNIERGQVAASNSYLRERWRYLCDDEKGHKPSQQTIRAFLKLLEGAQMITLNRKILPNRTTLITVVNYDKYQLLPQQLLPHPNNTLNNTLNNDPCNEINKVNEINKINITTTSLNAREKNLEYLSQYFDTANSATLEQTLMSLRRDNSAITMQDFKNIAWEVVSEWMQNKEPPAQTYTDFAKRLINTIRIINRNNKRNAIFEQQHPTTKTKAERDAEFAAFIAEKLSHNGTTKQIPDWG